MSTNDPAVGWLESQSAYLDDFDEYRNGSVDVGPADWWSEAFASMYMQPLYQLKDDDCLCDDGEDCSIVRSHEYRQDWREGREMDHTETLLWARSVSLAHDTHAHLLISKEVGDVPAARPARPSPTIHIDGQDVTQHIRGYTLNHTPTWTDEHQHVGDPDRVRPRPTY